MSYLELEVPVGSVSTNLKKPNATVDPSKFSYCLERKNATDDAYHCEVWCELCFVAVSFHPEPYVRQGWFGSGLSDRNAQRCA